MPIQTPFCKVVGIEHPIVLGGMMGQSDSKLTAAVSNAGGLGTLSSATFGLEGSREQMKLLNELTDKPYSVNLPLFHPMIPDLIPLLSEFDVKIVSTISLIPQVLEEVDIPVIAAGGIATGRGLLASLAMGAQGVQMGTRFIASAEAPAHQNWKQVLVNVGDSATAIACRNSSPTRMVKNEFFHEMDALDEPGKTAMDFMPIMGEGSKRIPDDVDGTKGNYTAGTGSGLIHDIKPAAEIMKDIMAETELCMEQMRGIFV